MIFTISYEYFVDLMQYLLTHMFDASLFVS